MRWFTAVALAILPFLLSGCASSPKPVTAAAVNIANIPMEVAGEIQKAADAWNAGNLDGFLELYAETATFTLPDHYLQGRKAIREFYAPNFRPAAPHYELTFERLDVEILCPEAVLVRGIYQNKLNGQTTRRGTTSLVMRPVLGRWKIIHDHSS